MWLPDRVAFTVGGLTVYWYGILIAGAVLAGYLLGEREQRRLRLPSGTMLDMFFYIVPLAIVCARLYYVAFSWDTFKDNPLEIVMITNGGLAIYGGVIGGILGAWIFSRRRKLPLPALLDMAVPSLVLGQAIGRWGNFFNQEAFGEVVTNTALQFFPVSVYIERLGEYHYATFFYESAWCLTVFAVLMLTRRRYLKFGDVFWWYLALYGSERAIVEGMRTDSLYLGNVRMSQLLSILMVLAVLLAFFMRIRGANRRGADNGAGESSQRAGALLVAGVACGAGVVIAQCLLGAGALGLAIQVALQLGVLAAAFALYRALSAAMKRAGIPRCIEYSPDVSAFPDDPSGTSDS